MENIIEFIFSSALFTNALLFIPQIVKIIKEKDTASVSLLTFLGFFLIQLAIVLHGIIKRDYLLILSYILSMITCGTVIILILRYKTSHKSSSNLNITLEEIIEQMPGHIYWKDKNGVFLGSNTNNWKNFGCTSLEDHIGKTDYDLFSQDQADLLRQVDLEVMHTGQSKIAEEDVKAVDKTTLYLSHKAALRNRSNAIVGILGVSLDITDARKKEIEQLALLENIIALTPGHVYWLNRDNTYLGCNNNQAKSAGLSSRQEIIGKRNKDLPWNSNPKMSVENLDRINKQVMETGIAVMIEEPALLPDGNELLFLSNKAPIRNSDGKIIGMVGISIDITEQRQIAKKELQDVQQKLDGMMLVSSSIAHELRTPLSSFGIAADNIKVVFPQLKQAYLWAKENNAPIENISPSYLSYIEKSLISMQKEIEAAFTFINISLLNTNPALDIGKPEILSINNIIEDALSRYPFMADQKKLVTWQKNSLDFFIKTDKALMTHVIFNLLKNALHYIAKSNKGNIHIWLDQDTIYNIIYFKDTGSGIPQKNLPKIFDHFFSTTDRSSHPAGVGLTFCKSVMESLHGLIECKSIEGDYTLFILKFPKNH